MLRECDQDWAGQLTVMRTASECTSFGNGRNTYDFFRLLPLDRLAKKITRFMIIGKTDRQVFDRGLPERRRLDLAGHVLGVAYGFHVSLFLEDRDGRKRDEAGVAAPLTAPQSAAGSIRRDLAAVCFMPDISLLGIARSTLQVIDRPQKRDQLRARRPAECCGACKMAG